MAAPRIPGNIFALIFLFAFLIGLIQVGAIRIAFDKLGLSEGSAILLLFSSLIGSFINLPLFRIDAATPPPDTPLPQGRLWFFQPLYSHGKTLIALNVGGAVIPACFSLYLLLNYAITPGEALLGIALITLLARLSSRLIPGLGIGMPIFIAPLGAALVAVAINPAQSAPLSYISGALGVLIGADLLRLNDIRKLGVPFAAIGGAGTFDGIFITGIVAVLLA